MPRPLVARAARPRWPYLDALRFTDRPVVVLDRAAACELLVLATCAGRVSNPLAFGRELASSSGDTAGAW